MECIYSSYSTMYWCFIKLFYLFARCLLVRRRTQRLGRSFAVTEPSLWPEQSGLVSVAPKLAVPTTLCFVDTVPHAFVQIQGISQKGLALHICTHMEDECNSSTHCRLGVCKTFLANPLYIYVHIQMHVQSTTGTHMIPTHPPTHTRAHTLVHPTLSDVHCTPPCQCTLFSSNRLLMYTRALVSKVTITTGTDGAKQGSQ